MRRLLQLSNLPAAALLVSAALLLSACSAGAPFRHEPLDQLDVIERAVVKERGVFRVRASVPSPKEAERLFGVPVYDRDIQPVWLEIENRGSSRARFVLSSVDPQYFSPLEVAYIHRKRLSKQGWMDLEKYLYQNAMPRQLAANTTTSGFVFTHRVAGTKAFNVDIFDTAPGNDYERFTFFIEVPGFRPDHADIDFRALYTDAEVSHLDTDGLRARLAELPCCATDRSGERPGRPVTVVFVARPLELLNALLHAGWSETSYQRDEKWLEAAQYLFGRPPDAIFRKARDRTTERIELSVWLAPYTVDGRPVWLAQTRHAIGRRYAIGEMFFGARLDPDVNDGRNYVMQDIWYAQALQHWAWSESLPLVPSDAPRMDFDGNPWFARTPYRVVLWIADRPTAMHEVTEIRWLSDALYRGEHP